MLGWFPGGTQQAFVGAVPLRLVDTRNAIGGPRGVLTEPSPRAVPVRGVTLSVNGVARQVPADASAVALNVTMVDAGAAAELSGACMRSLSGAPRPVSDQKWGQ